MTVAYLKSKIEEVLDLLRGYASITYSQEGEDLILENLFADKEKGFYVDVGAHHPKRFSNTYLLYKKGWRGVNIDATPGSMNQFRKSRADDVNIETAISINGGRKYLFQFRESALNYISDKDESNKRFSTEMKYAKVGVNSSPLSHVLDTHAKDIDIDLMIIDVEGVDLEVLKSNNWNQNMPRVLMVEIINDDESDIGEHKIHKFLTGQGYSLKFRTFRNAIYLHPDKSIKKGKA